MSESPPLQHGWHAYKARKCRCDVCTAAWTAYAADRRRDRFAAMLAGGMPPSLHGTLTGYTNWGCRCAPCRGARSIYGKTRRRVANQEEHP